MHKITHTQFVQAPIEEVWRFFSQPANLTKLMPGKMAIEIRSPAPTLMYEGLVLKYRISAFPGIKFPWVARITVVEHQHYFTDEQLRGPFRYWRHQHIFEPEDTGTRIKDVLKVQLPLGIVGKLFYGLFVRHMLVNTFKARQRKIAAILETQDN